MAHRTSFRSSSSSSSSSTSSSAITSLPMLSLKLIWIALLIMSTGITIVRSQTLPACALQCTIQSLSGTPCTVTNITCICTNAAFQLAFYDCQQQACSANDFQAALQYGAATCESNGTPINTSAVPSGASSTTSTPAATGSGNSSSSGMATGATNVSVSTTPLRGPETTLSSTPATAIMTTTTTTTTTTTAAMTTTTTTTTTTTAAAAATTTSASSASPAGQSFATRFAPWLLGSISVWLGLVMIL